MSGSPGTALLLNGQRGTITAIDDGLTVHLDTGPDVLIPVRYIEHGKLQLGYAVTTHRPKAMPPAP